MRARLLMSLVAAVLSCGWAGGCASVKSQEELRRELKDDLREREIETLKLRTEISDRESRIKELMLQQNGASDIVRQDLNAKIEQIQRSLPTLKESLGRLDAVERDTRDLQNQQRITEDEVKDLRSESARERKRRADWAERDRQLEEQGRSGSGGKVRG